MKYHRLWLAIFICLGLFTLLLINIFIPTNQYKNTSLVGKRVPTFTLPTVEGETLSDADLKGKLSALHFWATWCAGCYQEHIAITRYEIFQKIDLYGVGYKSETNDVSRWLSLYGNPYLKNAIDEVGKVSIEFGVRGTPELYIINEDGIIVFKHEGRLTQNVISVLQNHVNLRKSHE